VSPARFGKQALGSPGEHGWPAWALGVSAHRRFGGGAGMPLSMLEGLTAQPFVHV
jgi:hypothetical protein